MGSTRWDVGMIVCIRRPPDEKTWDFNCCSLSGPDVLKELCPKLSQDLEYFG